MLRGTILCLALLAAGCHDPIPVLEPPVDESARVAFFNALDEELQSWERLEAEGRHQEALMQNRRIGWIVLQNLPPVREALVSSNEDHRAIAAAAVGFSDDPSFNVQLRMCLASPDPRVVANALASLGHLRYPYLDPRQLAAYLESPDPAIRAAAAYYLGRTMTAAADEEVIGALIRAAADPDVGVRANAIAALGEIGDPLAVRALTDRLLTDPDPRLRVAAAKALAKIGGDEATGALLGSLERQGDVEAKRATFAALENASGRGFGRDEKAWWDWWQRHLEARARGGEPPYDPRDWEPPRRETRPIQPGPDRVQPGPDRVQPGPDRRDPGPGPGPGPDRVDPGPGPGPGPGPQPGPERPVEPVRPGVPPEVATSLSALEYGGPAERARAENDLVSLGSRALPEIVLRLQTAEETFALRLLAVAERIRDASVVPEVKRIFERPNLLIRLSALETIWNLAGPAELAFYEEALGDRWAKVRRKAARFAIESGSTRGIPVFIEALESEDLLVRGHAIEVLRRATGQDHGFDSNAPEPARQAAVARWKEWWAENRDSYRLK